MNPEYLLLFFTLSFFMFVSVIMILASLIIGKSSPDFEKLSPYECGFNPFEDSRKTFDIKFYITAILFIIFDVEVVLLLPLVFVLNFCLPFVLMFLVLLIFGFFYEWQKGILDWA